MMFSVIYHLQKEAGEERSTFQQFVDAGSFPNTFFF